jgi:hypothetical protein
MLLFQNILVEKYKFVLKNNEDGVLEYHHDLGNGNYLEIENLENIFSLICHINEFKPKDKMIIANRYECNTESELEFILLKGRWGDYFQSLK